MDLATLFSAPDLAGIITTCQRVGFALAEVGDRRAVAPFVREGLRDVCARARGVSPPAAAQHLADALWETIERIAADSTRAAA